MAAASIELPPAQIAATCARGGAGTIVTSQMPVEHWHEHIGDPTIADAVLDRLVDGSRRLDHGAGKR